MKNINKCHLMRLKKIEKSIHYDDPPPEGQSPIVVVKINSRILISAPHGARTYRNNEKEIWHEEDEFTAGMALLLGEICNVSVIATTWRIDDYDPNFTHNDNVQYKQALGQMIQQQHVRFVIDLHGAALNSPKLDPKQTIDLGLRQNKKNPTPSMNLAHVEKLENLLTNTGKQCDASAFVVGRNKFPGAGKGTINSFVVRQVIPETDTKVQSIQIEMKPQVRIASRFPTATLYKSCGPYRAPFENVMHMLQSLVDFIKYLKNYEE